MVLVSGRLVIFYLFYIFVRYLFDVSSQILFLVLGLGATRRITPTTARITPFTPASPDVALVAPCVCHNSQALSNECHGFPATTNNKTVSVGPGCPEPAMVVADSEE